MFVDVCWISCNRHTQHRVTCSSRDMDSFLEARCWASWNPIQEMLVSLGKKTLKQFTSFVKLFCTCLPCLFWKNAWVNCKFDSAWTRLSTLSRGMPRCGSLVGAAHPGRKTQQLACSTELVFEEKEGFLNWTTASIKADSDESFLCVFVFFSQRFELRFSMFLRSGRRPGGVGCPAPPRVRRCGAGRGVCCRGAGVRRWTAWCFTWPWISARPGPAASWWLVASESDIECNQCNLYIFIYIFFRSRSRWYASDKTRGSSQEKDN